MRHKRSVLLFVFFLFFNTSFAHAKEFQVPEPLKPWVGWALHGHEEKISCVSYFNNPDRQICSWPSELGLNFNGDGGTFEQEWKIYQEEYVPLPGNDRQWPLDVKVNGSPVSVVNKNGIPSFLAEPGELRVTGRFTWSGLPEYFQTQESTGLVSVSVNGDKIVFPNIDSEGRLWLKKDQVEEKLENRLKVESYRLIEDSIPAKIIISFTLDVAGAAREVVFGPIISPEKIVPVSLQASLPSKLENDGRLRVQARTGRYTFTLTARYVGQINSLEYYHPEDGYWPSEEVWFFSSKTNLRIVEIEGVHTIDPAQTSAPQQWRQFSAYRMASGSVMTFKEVKRGDPYPAPDQLELKRNLWLRFDGSGYSIRDQINGKKNTNWRLEMQPAIKLGKVLIDGKEQFITKQKGAQNTGIELREGLIDLTADSIYSGKISNLPALGWIHDFQKVEGTLHLPPGWKLLDARGIDNIGRTWIKQWTLLDFFLVLLFTIAVAKMFSNKLAMLGFVTMVLTYHEPNAPRYIWLALLIGFALLRYLPECEFKKYVKTYQILSVIILILITIPYSIHALRVGIYPQLAKPWYRMPVQELERAAYSKAPAVPQMVAEDAAMDQETMVQKVESLPEGVVGRRILSPISATNVKSSYYQTPVMQFDPKQMNQTGPGMPQWEWDSVRFSWSGPVTKEQSLSFTLIGPKVNLVLSFVRVFMIMLLGLLLLGFNYKKSQGVGFKNLKTLLPVGLFLLIATLSPVKSFASEIPSPEMIDELRTILLEKDKCFPQCAEISEAEIDITPEHLNIRLKADSDVKTAIPLPGSVKHWLPQYVNLNGAKTEGITRIRDNFWLLIPKGKNLIEINGKIRKQNTLQISFALNPHRVSVKTKGWIAEGVRDDNTIDSQLQFKRIAEEESSQISEVLESGVLPPFLIVNRTLFLGLVWKVETTVQRISPAGSAVVTNIPLLPGESVTTEGFQIKDGSLQVFLPPHQNQVSFESFLEATEAIELKHQETTEWTEIWRVNVSPIYHMEYEGIPVILHKDGDRWLPTWHPWPGEKINLVISRPAGAEGQTLTIENSLLSLKPGQRSSTAKLTLTINSSQGGQHSIFLPEGAELQEVKIANQIQPIRQEGNLVPLPITPGHQNIELSWRVPKGIDVQYKTPAVDLGTPSVNTTIEVQLSQNRWPLLVGGELLMGPAVLFWSVLFVVLLTAFGLSKSGLTPLRSYQWFLLGIGMAMSNLFACLLVVGWLIALNLKKEHAEKIDKNAYNLYQTGLVCLTIMALGALVFAISQGLLGHPDMNIVGNGSSGWFLRWYHDWSGNTLPQAWIVSVPLIYYRAAMLFWALWISFGLVRILKWGWGSFSSPMLWHHREKVKIDEKVEEDS